MPARLMTSRASYSKNLIGWCPGWERSSEPYMEACERGGRTRASGRCGALRLHGHEPVGLGELGVLAGEHFGQVDHHLALLPGGVVLHLAVDHVHAPTVRDGLDHLFGERDLRGLGRE